MTEAELLAEVSSLAERLGLLWHHCPAAHRCQGQRGFPDLVIAGPRGVLFVELKSAEGETTADQDRWLWTIGKAEAGVGYELHCALWRPSSLEAGLIRLMLETIAGQ